MTDIFYMPTKVICEEGCVEKHMAEMAGFGGKCLIVTGASSAKKSGAYDDVLSVLRQMGVESFLFDRIMENPTYEILQEARDEYIGEGIGFVIGIGGGSPMDAAKMIAILLNNHELKARDLKVQGDLGGLPLVVVPTTSGTGSEVTSNSVITDHESGGKGSCKARLFPRVAFLDVRYYMTMPEAVTRSTGADVLSHLLEGYLVKGSTKFSDSLAVMGFDFFKKSMWDLKDGNFTKEMHQNLMFASTVAGMVISHSGTGVPHGMGYHLTYDHGLYHGKASALFLASLVDMHMTKEHPGQEKARKLLRMLGFDNVKELREYILGVVGEYCISEEDLKRYALAMSGNTRKLTSHDFPISYEDIEKAFRDSLQSDM